MKCIIFLMLLVALSNAYLAYPTQREIRVDDDRRIFITGSRKMVIFNVPKDDPGSIAIIVKEQGRMKRIIKINKDKQITTQITLTPKMGMEGAFFENQDSDNQPSQVNNQQMKVLVNIFKKYEGIADEAKFYQLLKEVKQSVERLELNSIVYDVLRELEVSPVKRDDILEGNKKTNVSVKDETETTIKPPDFKDVDENLEQKIKLNQALQAARQIAWIRSIFENKPGHSQVSFNETGALFNNQTEGDLKQIVLQTNIEELQREIIQEQFKVQQLQLQQHFLSGQKQQLKLYQHIGQQSQIRLLSDVYEQVRREEARLLEGQLQIQKAIHALQETLIRQQEKLKEELRRETNKEE